jgi:hypothetical protein
MREELESFIVLRYLKWKRLNTYSVLFWYVKCVVRQVHGQDVRKIFLISTTAGERERLGKSELMNIEPSN